MDPSTIQQPSSDSRTNSASLEKAKKPSNGLMAKFRRIVRNFTPSWFTVSMGTGMVSILLYRLPYNGVWLWYLSVILFVFDLGLYLLFTLISALRYICYPEIWPAMLRHPIEPLFLGTFPMSLGVIIEMIIFVCTPAWGPWATIMAWTLWWIEVVISVAICFYLPLTIMTVHKAEISSLTTLWLLPIVSVIVCAATGGIVAGALVNQTHALWTLILSYVLWGVGIPLAMFTLVMYYHRLTMHKLPPPAIIASSFLPLGPLGEGGYSIMKMGQVSLTIFSNTGTLTPSAGEIIYIFGFLTALMMWGFALAWLFWAIAAFGRSKSPFNMGWWGIIFASAVFTGSTIALGEEIPSRFFSVLSTIFTVIIVLFWMVVSVQTIRGTISGAMFFSPVAAELDASKESSDSES